MAKLFLMDGRGREGGMEPDIVLRGVESIGWTKGIGITVDFVNEPWFEDAQNVTDWKKHGGWALVISVNDDGYVTTRYGIYKFWELEV